MVKQVLALLASLFLLTSCATGPTVGDQIAAKDAYTFSAKSGLRSNVAIGKISNETGLFGATNEVDSTDYKEALEKSLSKSGALASSPADAAYKLDAAFEYDNESPRFLDKIVTLQTVYTLRQIKDDKTVFTRTIKTSDHFENKIRQDLGVVAAILFSSPAQQQANFRNCMVNSAQQNIKEFMAAFAKWR